MTNGLIATASCETVKISSFTNVNGLELNLTFIEHGSNSVYALEQVNDTMMVTGGDDLQIFIWRLSDGLVLMRINASDVVYSLRVLSDGVSLAAGTNSGCIDIYNIEGIE